MQRHFFAGAPSGELDKQGRMVIPADAARARGHRAATSPWPASTTIWRSGIAPTGAAAARGRRERRRCCRASCQPRPTTSPSSRTKCSPHSRPRPGETVIDCTFGAGGHAGLLAARLHGDGKLIAIDRDPRSRRSSTASAREPRVKARLLHGEFSLVLEQLAGTAWRADVILLDLGASPLRSYCSASPCSRRPSWPTS